MSTDQVQEGRVHLGVQNIGGINDTSATFTPGVTILAGENATNRTSLLQALMGGLGSDDVSIKGDADEAGVELEIDGETYLREFQRNGDQIISNGNPYLDDSTLADLFAFLLESNEARRAVTRNADLRDIIMEPIDTEEIEAEISRLVDQRRQIEQDLDSLDSFKTKLPNLESERQSLKDEIEETKTELKDTEGALESRDADVEESQEEKAELESKLSALGERRGSLEEIRYELETERNSLESLRNEKRELEQEKGDLSEVAGGDIDEIDDEINRLRDQKQQLESEISDLQSVIQFNEEMLGARNVELLQQPADRDGAITDRLLSDDPVTCWTCGSEVETGEIEATIEQMKSLNKDKLDRVSEVDTELDELTQTRREFKSQEQRQRQIERRLDTIDSEIESTESTIEDLSNRRESVSKEIETIEDEIEQLEDDSYDEILSLHREANQLEYDLGRLETELERIDDEIANIEDKLSQESDLKNQLEELNEEIESLRTSIERTERQAIEEFNSHMDTVLDLLDYQNLDRIWLERVERNVREGRKKVTKSIFELHIIRRTQSGTTYEDTLAHLSESEREVTGLVFALAGYLAHTVYERVPFMLLDSLEAIDSDRIARLIDYLKEYTPYLVVALLEEDASALPDSYPRIREI